jgi:phosphate transport system permease protein
MDRMTRRRIIDRVALILTILCILIAFIPLASILWEVVSRGVAALDLNFLTQLPKPVGEVGGGVGNAIQGTFILVGLACAIGLPVGIMSGIYIAEWGESRVAKVASFFSDVLTGFPSIVLGIFAYILMVVPLRSFSALSGAFALSIIMIPTVTRTTVESMRLVPNTLREAGLALGIPRWKTILRIILSSARSGTITGIMLGFARIAGETAPLVLTAFGNFYWFTNIFGPTASLPVLIWTYSTSPYNDWHSKAWGAAMVLLLLVLSLNIIMKTASRRRPWKKAKVKER